MTFKQFSDVFWESKKDLISNFKDFLNEWPYDFVLWTEKSISETSLEYILLSVKEYLKISFEEETVINSFSKLKFDGSNAWQIESLTSLVIILEKSDYKSIEEFIKAEVDPEFDLEKYIPEFEAEQERKESLKPKRKKFLGIF